MKKKIVILFICLIFSMFLLESSGQQEKVISSEPLTFSMLFNETQAAPLKEDWLVLEEYKKRKNVVFDIQVANDSHYENAINVALNSGNPPDIILKVWPQTILEYANNGFLLPISDYIDQLPYFKAYIKAENLEQEINKLTMKNGKFYILPGFQRKIQVQQWIYRKDIFDKNSLNAPKTYEELFNSLVFLKKKYPNTTPISATWGGAHLFAMIGASFGIPAGWRGNQFYDTKNNRWAYAPASENYKEMLIFLNRCYEAEILDPAFLTQSDNEFYEKIQNGKVLVTPTWITSGFDNWNEKLKQNGYPNGEWAPFPVAKSPMGIRALPPIDKFRKGLVLSADVKNKPYFNDLLKFVDWALYSKEGQNLTYWGVEGVTFTETKEGKAFLSSIATPKNPEGTINAKSEYGLDNFFNNVENEELEDYKKPKEIVSFLNESLKNDETEKLPPQLSLNEESLEAVNLLLQPLDLYVAETSIKFITGELDIENHWEKYLNELSRYGYITLENIWNSTEN